MLGIPSPILLANGNDFGRFGIAPAFGRAMGRLAAGKEDKG